MKIIEGNVYLILYEGKHLVGQPVNSITSGTTFMVGLYSLEKPYVQESQFFELCSANNILRNLGPDEEFEFQDFMENNPEYFI